ncbi:hypothetical protein [Amycolatopsis cihanbeyliensis]|uniref:DUF308 domain-containing protein n=1 Tax=Amycolatopsis cihanbeyliensis TaxID=1128664 RepID=A0A542CT43_AMYCI|nr:hypothetical protein [Amycolatopsis cihanbeyliensis]TQI93975.1 hypothetical protein FB471_6121 [Amycolatopsis cihanbeyliensis]
MSRVGGSDGPEDVDATFAEIVADLRAQGVGDGLGKGDTEEPETRRERNTGDTEEVGDGGESEERGVSRPPARPASDWRSSDTEWDATMLDGSQPAGGGTEDEDEHYVPPEPPPLPKPRKGAIVVLLFFVIALVLLIAPGLVGLSSSVGTPLGLLGLAAALALLLLRVKQGPPDGADPSTGAQV